MPKSMPPKKNLKIPPQLLPPVQRRDLASQMRGLNINRPNLTIRKPTEVKKDIDKKLDGINKKMKGRRANVDDIMKELRKMNVKVTEQKTEKKGGKKTRRKRRRKRKKTRRR
tara:strand:+ start:3291 stop:3626 length:336 start_codon:yes stop_codon:yes gene_type:complete